MKYQKEIIIAYISIVTIFVIYINVMTTFNESQTESDQSDRRNAERNHVDRSSPQSSDPMDLENFCRQHKNDGEFAVKRLLNRVKGKRLRNVRFRVDTVGEPNMFSACKKSEGCVGQINGYLMDRHRMVCQVNIHYMSMSEDLYQTKMERVNDLNDCEISDLGYYMDTFAVYCKK